MSDTKHTAYESWQGRYADIQRMATAEPEDAEYGDDARDAYALSIEPVYQIDVMLTVGGPTQYLRFTFDTPSDDEPLRAEFVDSWASPESITLTDDEAATAWQVLGFGLSCSDALGL